MADAPVIPRGIAAKIRWVVDHHPWIWLLVGVEQLATDHILGGVIFLALFGVNLFVYEMWERFSQLAKQMAGRWRGEGRAPALDDISPRLAEAERGIEQNKANLLELRTRVNQLTDSLRARDAESIFKEADHVFMSTSGRLLEEHYPDEAAWAADYAVWETAMRQIENLMSQWQPHDKPFLDIRPKDLEGAPAPPPQSNIRLVTNIIGYETVWVAKQRYATRRESILQYFFFKAGELPG
jgi:hypothetical protein